MNNQKRKTIKEFWLMMGGDDEK